MANTENASWLWPLKGGTWKDRLKAAPYIAILALMAAAFCCLFWALAPYF